jgi:hypothetical protein
MAEEDSVPAEEAGDTAAAAGQEKAEKTGKAEDIGTTSLASGTAEPPATAVEAEGKTARAGSSGRAHDSLLAMAGLASVAAGIIHATAAGSHSEERQAVIAFAAVAAFQVAWGAWALVRSNRWIALIGAVGNAAAVGGWVLAKTSSDGIGFVKGLDHKESAQFADTLCAALAGVAVLIAATVAFGLFSRQRAFRPSLIGAAAVATVVLSVPGMVAAGNHSHAGGDDHPHGSESADGHDDHGTAGVPPKEFDPNLPIDLSGVPGVSLEQQARAENMLAENLLRLPQWSDPAVAEAAGYRSIGDALTGDEHYIKWDLIDDEHQFDPDYPESLVYNVDRATGEKTLEAAMYMMPTGSTLDDVPDIGGDMTQFHIHDNLCFSNEEAPRVAGVTESGGECPPGTQRLTPVPMMHVWILPNPCGPFAALEGVGAGQVKEGEERSCDHVHGSGSS